MHNFLDESFNIYSLNLVRAGNKVKYPRLAIFFALLVFWEVAARSSSGMSRFIFFLILVSCWCNGLDQSYMENGFLCLLALALRFRVSACMYVTLSHYRGEFREVSWFFNKARSGILVSVLRVSARAGSIYKVSCSYLIYSESYSRCMKMQKKGAIWQCHQTPRNLKILLRVPCSR